MIFEISPTILVSIRIVLRTVLKIFDFPGSALFPVTQSREIGISSQTLCTTFPPFIFRFGFRNFTGSTFIAVPIPMNMNGVCCGSRKI